MAARTPATPGAPASSATLAVSVARLTCACTPGKRSRTRSIREAQAAQVMPVMARSSVVGDSMASIARGARCVLSTVDAGFIGSLYTLVGYIAPYASRVLGTPLTPTLSPLCGERELSCGTPRAGFARRGSGPVALRWVRGRLLLAF